MNDKNKQRYTNNLEFNGKPVTTNHGRDAEGRPILVTAPTAEGKVRKQMILKASADTFGFDCVCLIKGILWGWNGNVNANYGGAAYKSNGVTDVGANGLINQCRCVSSDFRNIQIGECVWMPGHVGIYIGDGKVVECTPKWENKVQITNLGNIGNKTGHYRMWSKHGLIPWVDYSEGDTDTYKPDPVTSDAIGKRTYIVKKGDTLTKIAAKYFTTVDKIVKDNEKAHKTITRDHIVAGWKLLV